MKKNLFTVLCLVLLLISPVITHASDLPLSTGYTEEGIYYEVFGELPNSNAKGTLSVTREVVFYSIITPPSTITWQETIYGRQYSGVLTLQNFFYNYSADETVAEYQGLLTSQ